MDKKLIKIQVFTNDMVLVKEGEADFSDTDILMLVINEDGTDVQITQVVPD